ncbi:glutaredoxin domain-containing protein [Nocardia takedensis]|uniref:glutaredoxin domain-containing protein n=1 Tax=Nocardia takedensis TaxID=259390 RepID=UPI003F768FB8
MTVFAFTRPECRKSRATIYALTLADIDFIECDITRDRAALEQMCALGYTATPTVVITAPAGAMGRAHTVTAHWTGFQPGRIFALPVAA